MGEDAAWMRVILSPATIRARGAQVADAIERGLRELDLKTDVVVKADADVSFGPEHLERLLAAFS